MRGIAYRELSGVGDAQLGEWTNASPRAFHLRRRLSLQEESIIGPAVDIRGDTAEVERRLKPVRHIVGWNWKE